jgi:hypothetical protein
MAQPVRVGTSSPGDFGFVPAGTELTIRIDGERAAGDNKTGLFARVFYRVAGIPIAHDLYNDAAIHTGVLFSNDPAKTLPFAPLAKFHSLRVMAWDRVAPITKVADVKSKLSRFQGLKTD